MEITDACGKPIAEGSYVIYQGTGTMGKVTAIKTIDNDIWAKIASTNLWYKSNTLQVIDKGDEKLTKLSKEDLKEKIRRIRKTVGEDIDMSSELCDGGG
ncbi:MAG: DUF2098 domain-containing protein [Methanobacteriaceae archaeon]|jgi:hypothetical protein